MRLVEHVLSAAQGRLAVLRPESLICQAAEILMNRNTPLVLICADEQLLVGVISRSDVIGVLTSAEVDARSTRADSIMTRKVVSCRLHQPLQAIWETMNARSLRCVPVLGDEGRPKGILHARDIAAALLEEIANEEVLLRDYVLGIGYR
jgi:CBS domain-containing protein